MAQYDRMRWYNPKLRRFEWRKMPEDDAGALALFGSASPHEVAVATYREWRALGASVPASLIRAGDAAKNHDGGQRS